MNGEELLNFAVSFASRRSKAADICRVTVSNNELVVEESRLLSSVDVDGTSWIGVLVVAARLDVVPGDLKRLPRFAIFSMMCWRESWSLVWTGINWEGSREESQDSTQPS